MDEFQKKIEIFKIISDLAEKETDRYWIRYRTMFLINSAIGAIISFTPDNIRMIVILFCSPIGFFTSYSWLQIIRWSEYYQDRWVRDQIAIINSDQFLSDYIKGRSEERLKKPEMISIRKLFWVGPVVFLVIWIMLISLSVISVAWPMSI